MCWKLNTLNYLSNKEHVPNKTEDLNLRVFNMIIGINESKTLTKHISTNANVNFMEENIIQINGGIKMNIDVSVKNVMFVKETMFGIQLHVMRKMENI